MDIDDTSIPIADVTTVSLPVKRKRTGVVTIACETCRKRKTKVRYFSL
jgi:hypothetical protein